MRAGTALAVAAALAALSLPAVAAGHPGQHGPPDGHLPGTGGQRALELIGGAKLTDVNDLVADVAVSPDGHYAYLGNWGRADCAANSEAGGRSNPDAGAWIVDIKDPSAPKQIGFIATRRTARPAKARRSSTSRRRASAARRSS